MFDVGLALDGLSFGCPPYVCLLPLRVPESVSGGDDTNKSFFSLKNCAEIVVDILHISTETSEELSVISHDVYPP